MGAMTPDTDGSCTAAVGIVLPRDAVSVTGSDAASYLQGQISQDIYALSSGESAWSLVLAPRGKVIAWFRLTRRVDDFLLDLDAGFGEALIARLEQFKPRVDGSAAALDGWRMLAVRGPGAVESGMSAAAVGAEMRAEVRWPGFSGVDLLGPAVEAPDGLRLSTVEEFEAARIRAGWPAMGRELTERTIPAEVPGLVESSVSFTKGCYTGQELVARIDSRGGNVPRPMRLIEVDAAAGVEAGAEITVGGRAVGKVTSAAVERAAAVTVALGPVHRSVTPPVPAVVADRPAVVLALR